MIFLRLSTYKENEVDQIIFLSTFLLEQKFSPTMFGDVIYNHSLFNIPRILDLCSLYGNSNSSLLSKMINNVFTNQTKYWNDLEYSVQTNVASVSCHVTVM